MKRDFLNNQKGFSLVEITIAAGMLGVLTTIILNLSEQQVSFEKRTEVNAELGFFHARLAEVFNDKTTCQNTLNQGPEPTPLKILTNNMAISDIRDNTGSGGAILYSANYQFGKILDTGTNERTFKIKSINLEFITDVNKLTGDPSAPDYKSPATLNVVYEISTLLTSYQGNREKPKTISLGDIQLTRDGSSYRFRGCVGNSSFISITPRSVCESLAGVYDSGIAGDNKCRLPHFLDYATPSTVQICSSSDASYCTTKWTPTNLSERQGAPARALVDYTRRIYGKGTPPGSNNLFLGWEAGLNNNSATGAHNTFIGSNAGKDNTTGKYNIMIGKDISVSGNTGIIATGEAQLNIGNLLIGKMPIGTTGSQRVGTNTGITINGGMNVLNYVKVGTSNIACNATNVGTLKLNNARNRLQLCNGTSWVFLTPTP